MGGPAEPPVDLPPDVALFDYHFSLHSLGLVYYQRVTKRLPSAQMKINVKRGEIVKATEVNKDWLWVPNPGGYLPLTAQGTGNAIFTKVQEGSEDVLPSQTVQMGGGSSVGVAANCVPGCINPSCGVHHKKCPNYKASESASALASELASCAICLIDFSCSDTLQTLPCRHQFHKRCIQKWLRCRNVCPLCLQKVD